MRRVVSNFWLILWLFLFGFSHNVLYAQVRQNRIALVIGNTGYTQLPKLRNAAGDAFSVARALSKNGFTVFFAQDVSGSEFKDTLSFVSKRAAYADHILVYYAGHSEIRNGTAELLSVDSIGNPKASAAAAISVTDMLSYFDVPFAQKAFILDTCLESTVENPQSLLLPKALQLETLLVFATSFGQAAYDGTGSHSIFTGALLDQITNGQHDLETTVQSIRREVIRNSRSSQTPVSISTLTRPFALNSKVTVSQSFATQNNLIQSYSSSGYANKPLLDTISIGISPTGLLNRK